MSLPKIDELLNPKQETNPCPDIPKSKEVDIKRMHGLDKVDKAYSEELYEKIIRNIIYPIRFTIDEKRDL